MKRDHVLGTVLVLLGLLGLWMTAQIPVKTFTDDPGPRLFPNLGSIVLIISGCGVALLGRVGPADDGERGLDAAAVRRMLVMAGALVAYTLAMWLVGFYPATWVMTLVFHALIAGPERRSLVRGAIFSTVLTAVVWLVFTRGLNAFLPQGQWG